LGAALVVFAAGFATAWSWQSNKLDAELERGKSALLAIRAGYAAAETAAKTAADALRDQDQAKASEVEREYQATIDRLRRERSGPGPVVRVQCPPAGAVSAARDRPASDPGSPAGAAADAGGVAGDGATGYRDLDAAGIRALTTEAMLVSERLRALQARCSG
jgi:hypothetical protein